MKLQRRKNKNTAKIIIAIVLVFGLGYAVYQHISNAQHKVATTTATSSSSRKVNDVNYSPPTAQDKAAQDQLKTDIINNYEQQSGQPPATITISISRATQSSGMLSVRTVITGTTAGSCEITLSKTGQPKVVKDYQIAPEATYATCSGSDIPLSDIPTDGQWQLQVVAKNGSASSAPVTQTVTISHG